MKDIARFPNERVVQFARNRGPHKSCIALDIGSGAGRNAEALRLFGWAVLTLDNDPEMKAYFCKDIREWSIPPNYFDLILDCNTLCHVEDAPYQKIYDGLEPGGVFFSIHPTPKTVPVIAAGRWTREADANDIYNSLKMFVPEKIKLRDDKYWDDKRDTYIYSWWIKAEK